MRALVFCLCLAAAPALAQTDAPASDNGRYVMTPTADGFLRLDTRTGKVSLCALREGAAQCCAAADEREAWEREIADLRRQNAELKAGRAAPTLRLPSEQELDQAMTVMERLARRLGRILREETQTQPDGAPL